MVDVLLGIQWGDEGKGKIVDFLAKNYNIIARFNGGGNAGHTLYVKDKKVVLHTIPSGAFHTKCLNFIGNGVVLDPISFFVELDEVAQYAPDILKRLFISEKTTLILPSHRALDAAYEKSRSDNMHFSIVGSTLKGIGPAYLDKTGRTALKVGNIFEKDFKETYFAIKNKHISTINTLDVSNNYNIDEYDIEFFAAIERLKGLNIVNGEYWINQKLKENYKILAEGAQGTMLDIDYGTYPYVTSSNTISGAVCAGLGVSPLKIGTVHGVTKAYCTRVGNGPFPTELFDESGDELRRLGSEFGATTGRPRRCGWIDLVALKYTLMLNGVTSLIITKSDILDEFKTIYACVAYDVNGIKTTEMPFNISDATPVYKEFRGWSKPVNNCIDKNSLPGEFLNYINYLEIYLGVTVTFISNGTGRDQLIELTSLSYQE